MLPATFSTSFQIALAVTQAFAAARPVVFLAWISVFRGNVPSKVAGVKRSFLPIWGSMGLRVDRLRCTEGTSSTVAAMVREVFRGRVRTPPSRPMGASGVREARFHAGQRPGSEVAVATIGSLAAGKSGASWPTHPGGVGCRLPLALRTAIVAIMAGSLCMPP
jgi:hypothetical protein